MKTTPIYIKSIELQNIRTFGEVEILHLDKEDGTIPQWTLILGDNGIGKSTLLQCIAWMKPLIPHEEDEDEEDEDEDEGYGLLLMSEDLAKNKLSNWTNRNLANPPILIRYPNDTVRLLGRNGQKWQLSGEFDFNELPQSIQDAWSNGIFYVESNTNEEQFLTSKGGHTYVEDAPPEPRITDEQNERLEQLVRISNAPADAVSANIQALFIANKKLNHENSSNTESTCGTSITIELKEDGKLREADAAFKTTNKGLFLKNEVLIYGYSASRQLGKLNLDDPLLDDTIPSFIAEKTILYDAEEILNQSNYAALGSEGEEKEKIQKYIVQIKRMLVSVLPDVEKISDIDILAPTLLGTKMRPGIVVITTKHGEKIPLGDMSLGYKNVISWTIDLAWRLSRQYPDSDNPLAEPAIVLIDEIDLHLHPVWQREIMNRLSKHFKNTQFIATAHSPLMVQAAIESNYAVLIQHENGVKILNDPKGIDGWRVDQILTSEIFGLKSARGIKYDELFSRREILANKKGLKPEEKAELKTINEQMSKLPSGESPDEIDNRKLISEIVSNIKKNKKKIDL